jgi:hypothetical protein
MSVKPIDFPRIPKSGIGTLAALCTAFFPPPISILAEPERSRKIERFYHPYIAAAIISSLLVGGGDRDRSDALLATVWIKRQTGVAPSLMNAQ